MDSIFVNSFSGSKVSWTLEKRGPGLRLLTINSISHCLNLFRFFSYLRTHFLKIVFICHNTIILKSVALGASISLLEKITVIKRLIISQLFYILSPLPTDQRVVKEVNNLCYNFLCEGKGDHIKRDTMISGYEQGGLRPCLQAGRVTLLLGLP